MDRAKTAWRDSLPAAINAPRMNGANTDISRGWRRLIRKKPQKRNGAGRSVKIPQEMLAMVLQQRNGGTDGANDAAARSAENRWRNDEWIWRILELNGSRQHQI